MDNKKIALELMKLAKTLSADEKVSPSQLKKYNELVGKLKTLLDTALDVGQAVISQSKNMGYDFELVGNRLQSRFIGPMMKIIEEIEDYDKIY